MTDVIDHGRRPLVRSQNGSAPDTSAALAHCPGIALEHPPQADPGPAAADPDLYTYWGPVLEVWEGYATDAEIRFAGSSGGAITALALHCVESEDMHGALHIRARADAPHLNETTLSRTRAELLAATGSRYAPASPCDGLDRVERAPKPCVFVGKPCDVAATASIRRQRPALDERLGLTIGFFCAGTPSSRGTLEMLSLLGVDDLSELEALRYRGNGWPGRAVALRKSSRTGETVETSLSYEESWADILQRHRQWRCHVCADHTGEFADVSVGDPWYRPIDHEDPGRSLVIVRTERGRRLLHRARDAGALALEALPADKIAASQPNLLRARGAVWGRVQTSRLLGVPRPVYRNIPTLPAWWHVLTPREKARSVYGTALRIWRRRLHRPLPTDPPAANTAENR